MSDSKGGQVTVKLVLDADAAALLLQLAGGVRSQGKYVSKLVRAAAANDLPYLDLTDEIRQFEQQVTQQLAELKQRVDRATIAATHARLIPDEEAPPYDLRG